MANTYWESKGKHQDLYDEMYKTLVPPEGEAETEHGEFLRLMSRIYYDLYNNGGCNLNEGWAMASYLKTFCKMLAQNNYDSDKRRHFEVYISMYFRSGMRKPFAEYDDDHYSDYYVEIDDTEEQKAFAALEDVADFVIQQVKIAAK